MFRERSTRHHTKTWIPTSTLVFYNDAVFATIATIMVVPLKVYGDTLSEGETLQEYLRGETESFLAYFCTFFMVLEFWRVDLSLYASLKAANLGLCVLNGAYLLTMSFLPYTSSLMGRFGGLNIIAAKGSTEVERFIVSVVLCCMNFMAATIAQYACFWYARKYEMLDDPDNVVHRKVRGAGLDLSRFIISVIVVVATLATSFWTRYSTYVYFGTYFSLTSIYYAFYFKPIDHIMFRGEVGERCMERAVALNEGIFGLATMLLVLDIPLPARNSTKQEIIHLWRSEIGPTVTAYVVTFYILGTMWGTQKLIFRRMRRLSELSLFANSCTLSLVAFTPYLVSLMAHFYDLKVAVEFSSVVIGLTGLSLVVFVILNRSYFYKVSKESVDSSRAPLLTPLVDLSVDPDAGMFEDTASYLVVCGSRIDMDFARLFPLPLSAGLMWGLSTINASLAPLGLLLSPGLHLLLWYFEVAHSEAFLFQTGGINVSAEVPAVMDRESGNVEPEHPGSTTSSQHNEIGDDSEITEVDSS